MRILELTSATLVLNLLAVCLTAAPHSISHTEVDAYGAQVLKGEDCKVKLPSNEAGCSSKPSKECKPEMCTISVTTGVGISVDVDLFPLGCQDDFAVVFAGCDRIDQEEVGDTEATGMGVTAVTRRACDGNCTPASPPTGECPSDGIKRKPVYKCDEPAGSVPKCTTIPMPDLGGYVDLAAWIAANFPQFGICGATVTVVQVGSGLKVCTNADKECKKSNEVKEYEHCGNVRDVPVACDNTVTAE